MIDRLPVMPPVVETPSMDDVLAGLREFMVEGIGAMFSRAIENVILPDDQAKLALDVAQVTTFLMAIKLCEIRQLPITVENLMRWYWPMQKALKDEVPGQLRAYAKAYAEAQASGQL